MGFVDSNSPASWKYTFAGSALMGSLAWNYTPPA
jgi:hypothetical protein